MEEYKAGDIIKDPSMDLVHELLGKYECEWVSIGVLMITENK